MSNDLNNIPNTKEMSKKHDSNDFENMSKGELLAILIGQGMKRGDAKQLADNIIKVYGDKLLDLTIDDLQVFPSIGRDKALRIFSALVLVKKLCKENQSPEVILELLQETCYNGRIERDYVTEDSQTTVFELLGLRNPISEVFLNEIPELQKSREKKLRQGYFGLHNRRFLGNKFKLLAFIEDIVNEKCNDYQVFCDIFAGTGVVAERFNNKDIKLIVNDFLKSNYTAVKAFLGISQINYSQIQKKIDFLNNLEAREENYFSKNFGNTYFTLENARKIGYIREMIDQIAENEEERVILLTTLIFATDKVANTVGHYDAFRKKMDSQQSLQLLYPDLKPANNIVNEVYNEDANQLIGRIDCDVLYIDPPYNSRQYSDAYHLLENLVCWEKPQVYGKAKKMNRTHIKSAYCLQTACEAFRDLIMKAKCKHILLSYNNTGETKDGRSNAKISDFQIIEILQSRGKVEVFERDYKAFTTGKSNGDGNTERVFYCQVMR